MSTEYKKHRGLTEQEISERIQAGMLNGVQKSPLKTEQEIVISHIVTYFNILNLFLGSLIFMTGKFVNAAFLMVVVLNSLIGIIQELKVKRLIDKLSVMTAVKASAIRDGEVREIKVEEIVLDDLLLLESGVQICSDCIVVESRGMEVNESMLTGESVPVKKKPGDKLLSGSYLTSGTGIGRVIHVGNENYAQALTMKAKTKRRASSEMQDTIKQIIKAVSIMIIPVGILLFVSQCAIGGLNVNESIVKTVGGVIGMIPEGLVLLTSVSFVLGVGRLARKRALVQEMEAIEALARVDVLCLDKTGTITTGELTVEQLIPEKGISIVDIRRVMNAMSFAFDDINPTQEALMRCFQNTGEWTAVETIPFSPERKYRAATFEGQGSFVLGAPEFFMDTTEELYLEALNYEENGMRVLLLGTCDRIDRETGEVFGVSSFGLIVLSDVIRPEAERTFQYFKENGVRVIVISGDNPVTVSKIAEKAGIQGAASYVDSSSLPDKPEELESAISQYAVFGRVTPEKKQHIIRAFQNNGHMVGMVGDGVNDVLAIKDADCGIAMAAGSEAAHQAAHIVLLDSDFACMPEIVREGRMIIGSIERVSALYLTKTLYSSLLCVIFILISRAYPFIPIQLTLISTITIGIPSFILTLEQTESVSKEGFLPHVMQISLPAALTMAVAMGAIQILHYFLHFTPEVLSTYNLLVGGTIGLTVLYRVCRPLNRLRGFLLGVLAAGFFFSVVGFKPILSIANLLQLDMIWVLPIIAGSMFMAQGLTHVAEKIYLYRKRRNADDKKTCRHK